MIKVTFGRDIMIGLPNLDEVDVLLKSCPGRILELVGTKERSTWYRYYSDGTDIYCGFRKSTSKTYHFFKLPNNRTFPEHIENLNLSGSLRFRRKTGFDAKGKGARKEGIAIYLGRERPTVSAKVPWLEQGGGYADLKL